MEGEEERPRKFPKLDHEEAQVDSEPTMTGAVGSVPDNNATEPTVERQNEPSTGLNPESQTPAEGENAEAPKLTKNQIKKQLRRQEWEAKREDRKFKRKEKLQEKKARRREEINEAREKGGQEAVQELVNSWGRGSRRNKQSVLLPLSLILDCSYDDLMHERERISLGSQLTRSYSENMKSPYRSHMAISSFDKLLKERFNTVLRKTHENWREIHIMEEDWTHAAEQSKEWMRSKDGGTLAGPFAAYPDAKPEDGEIVYLSSDSPNTLTELKPYSTYIIGGLVDKNRYKGICYKQAVEKGYKTAKLPIGEYIQMTDRQVLATNHVIEIMLRWIDLGDWGKAFMEVLPPRKGGVLKASGTASEEPSQPGDSVEEEEKQEAEAVAAAEEV